jgi:cytidylate kinase
MRPLIIAIDGPSGAGKGTVARNLAARLGYRHVDTGAMYRAVAWKALHDAIDLDDEETISRMAETMSLTALGGTVSVNGRDISREIRTPAIDAAAARVARQPKVRAVLIQQQRDLGAGGGVVMEGRDIGTVVFPDADVKLYLDASPEERARRRAHDSAHSAGGAAAVNDIATALEARDRLDRTRTASPLAVASDAMEIDTTRLSVDEVVERVLRVVESRRRE